jgi:hypothetical protein
MYTYLEPGIREIIDFDVIKIPRANRYTIQPVVGLKIPYLNNYECVRDVEQVAVSCGAGPVSGVGSETPLGFSPWKAFIG